MYSQCLSTIQHIHYYSLSTSTCNLLTLFYHLLSRLLSIRYLCDKINSYLTRLLLCLLNTSIICGFTVNVNENELVIVSVCNYDKGKEHEHFYDEGNRELILFAKMKYQHFHRM